jgi:carbon-monoxide dehydrogenase large subunit
MSEEAIQPEHMPVGNGRKRREDPDLIRGRARFVDDIRLDQGRPALLHMIVVRSPYAHARVEQIDVEEARTAPGVIAVVTGQEIAGQLNPLEGLSFPGIRKTTRFPLAVDEVCYVGDPVAVILAEKRSQGLDARDLVNVEYTPLPAVADVEEAARADAPLVHAELATNVAFTWSKSSGEVDEVFQNAEHTAQLRLVNQRLAPSSLETRACLFDYDASSGEFFAWLSSQAIFRAREALAQNLGLSPQHVHVRNASVGGAFGAKTVMLGEELTAAWLARQYGRPVKWIEERSENLQAMVQGRGQINYLDLAFQSDGRLLGIKVRTLADLGSYLHSIAALIPINSANMVIGPYRIAAVEGTVDLVYTNKPPITPYRGAGRPEATYMLERAMDQIARELDLDPVEVRRRNFIAPDAFPYHTITGMLYDSGNYPALLDRLLELGEYQQWREKQQEQRARGGTRLLGLGLSTFTEISGDVAPIPNMPKEAAAVRVCHDGTILVQSGVAHNGQGHFTIFAQLAADVFEVPIEQVRVEINNADLPVYSIGTFGSRVTQVGGSVVYQAARAAREKALQVAAHLLEAAPADLEMAGGQISVRGVPGRAISLGDLAHRVEETPALLANLGNLDELDGEQAMEGLAARQTFAPEGAAWSAGAHLAVVEVDTETGEIEVLRYIAVDDCGRVLHPGLAEAQLHGGLAQGIGQALYEEAAYDHEGQPLAASLLDYALPLAKNLPAFTSDFIETPSPINPLGAKGVGESGTIGAPPTIVNAVIDALAPLGITALDMPLSRERIWSLLS